MFLTVILGMVKDRGVCENMPRPSLLANLATLANLANLTILVSLATSPVVGLKIEASTESFTDGFADVPNGDLLVAEGWILHIIYNIEV